jgi:hypothetical protein
MTTPTPYNLFTPVASLSLDSKVVTEITVEVSAAVRAKYPVEVLRSPSDPQREEIKAEVQRLTAHAIRRRNLSGVAYAEEQKLAEDIVGRMVGLGFLDRLLPPTRRDISETFNPTLSKWTPSSRPSSANS